MATISFKTMSYLFIGSPESCGSDLIECLLERQRLNDMAVMRECSSRLRGEGFKPSPEWNEYLGKYGSEPEFVAQTVSYMNASVDPKTVYNWAETIVSALKQSGIHKLIFMVRLENGHVISDDIATIATVMGSIHQNEVPFSIIVYEIGMLQRVDVLVKDEVSKKVAEAMTYTKCATNSILFAPELHKRSEEIHAVAEFIKNGAPMVQIEPTLVRAMECGTFDKTRRALQERKLLLPTGEVPEMEVRTSAHKFESTASTEVTFLTLTEALRSMDAEFTYRPNWIIDGYALINAEEVFFQIDIFRSTATNAIKVLFTCLVLPMFQKETKFKELISRVLKYCESVDSDIFAKARRLAGQYYAAPGEGSPGMMGPNDLPPKITAARSSCQTLRLHAAMWLKDACRNEANRRTLLAFFRQEVAEVLCELLQDVDQTIVRFAVYAIKKFAESPAAVNDAFRLEIPQLDQTLMSIMALSSSPTTRKLAWQLFEALDDMASE